MKLAERKQRDANGSDLMPPETFADLLERLGEIPAINMTWDSSPARMAPCG